MRMYVVDRIEELMELAHEAERRSIAKNNGCRNQKAGEVAELRKLCVEMPYVRAEDIDVHRISCAIVVRNHNFGNKKWSDYRKIAALIEPTRITDKTLYDSYMGIRAYHEDVIVAQLKKEVTV